MAIRICCDGKLKIGNADYLGHDAENRKRKSTKTCVVGFSIGI